MATSQVTTITTSTIPMMDVNHNIIHLTLSSNQSNAVIVARMRELSAETPSNARNLAKKIMYALLMRKLSVGKGLVLKARDTESQTLIPQRVAKIKKDVTLTALVFGPGPIPETCDLYTYLVNGVKGNQAGYMEVWCIYHAVDPSAASIWLLVALSISAIIGLGVGFGLCDGELGLDVGTGLFAVFTGIHLAIVLGVVY